MKPRPWYLSLSAIWDDDIESSTKLYNVLNDMDMSLSYPYHHIPVNSQSRHLTVFAILRINTFPSTFNNFSDFSRSLFSSIIRDVHTMDQITNYIGKGFSLNAYELRVFDSGTAVQFRGTQSLALFREAVRDVLYAPVFNLASSYPEGTITPLINDQMKNVGTHAFGSVMRSPSRSDLNIERFRKTLPQEIKFKFKKIHLLISDEGLTNPRIRNIDDAII